MTDVYRYPVLHTHTYTRYIPLCVPTPKKLHRRLIWLFLGPFRDRCAAYAWPLGSMSDDESMPDEFWRPEPFSRGLSSHRKQSTAALSSNQVRAAGWHSVCTERSRRAFPRARSGRTIARRRMNLARKDSSRAHFAWLRVRGARARAVRERRILRASRLTILQDRSIH